MTFRNSRWVWVGLSLLIAALSLVWLNRAPTVESLIASAESLKSEQKYVEAEALLKRVFQESPNHAKALMLAAECAQRQGDYAGMFAYIDSILERDVDEWRKAHFTQARILHYQLAHFAEAEAVYKKLLKHNSELTEVHNELARLLGLLGRRYEAIPHVITLIRQGESTDLLMLVARESGAISDPELVAQGIVATQDDPNPWLAKAWQAAADLDTEASLLALEHALTINPTFGPAYAMQGKQLWSAGRFADLSKWVQKIPDEALRFPDTWMVQGQLADRRGDTEVAIRCFSEAIVRQPESKAAHAQLARLFSVIGEETTAERFRERVLHLQTLEDAQNKAIFGTTPGSYEDLVNYVLACIRVGRFWEAYAWGKVAFEIDSASPKLAPLWDRLVGQLPDLPNRLTAPAQNLVSTKELTKYPLPTLPAPAPVATSSNVMGLPPSSIRFRENAENVGLIFQYRNGAPLHRQQRRMYEFTGGGIGVLDYDVDGFPDIYLTQGQSTFGKPENAVDALFRNLSGKRFQSSGAQALLKDVMFGQGLAVGDVNADGFPDLFVGNIDENTLWLNQGDGTFVEATDESGVSGAAWTTSAVIADLNGDQLADIYEVNYLTGKDVMTRICQRGDASVMCLPFDFPGDQDRVWINQGDGTFEDQTDSILNVSPTGKGLGVMAWDAIGDGQLSVLVTNDTTPNFLFMPQRNQTGSDQRVLFEERGIVSGIALNATGKAEGCMGIAVADLNQNGQMDIHITNFLAESNTLYEAVPGGFFVDRTDEYGLSASTYSQLGFGTQFLDANNDGVLELIVANGHVDDLQAFGRSYRMPPQYFQWTGKAFQEIPLESLGPFFQQKWLGRAVVRLDWNCDGRDDVVVGQLADPISLLTNDTHAAGSSLSLKLTASNSERSAIGTTVQITLGDQTVTKQLMAGDGYQCSNERRVTFGCGTATKIDSLRVRWPSGTVSQYADVDIPASLIIREHAPELLPEAVK